MRGAGVHKARAGRVMRGGATETIRHQHEYFI
jgi:hypothetical protein